MSIADLSRRIESVDRNLRMLREQVVVHIPPPSNSYRTVWIIGGNALSTGHEAIQYAATVTPLAVYDPDVTTSYPSGLGNAWLFVDGELQANRVLVHHDFAGYTQPLLAGRIMRVRASEVLTFSGTDMEAMLLDLP